MRTGLEEVLERGTRKSWGAKSLPGKRQTSARRQRGPARFQRVRTEMFPRELALYKGTAVGMITCGYGWSLLALKIYEWVKNVQ